VCVVAAECYSAERCLVGGHLLQPVAYGIALGNGQRREKECDCIFGGKDE
jgi:hypothetical protein